MNLNITDGGVPDAPEMSALAFRAKAYWGYDDAFMEACREELAVPVEAFEAETVRIVSADGAMAGFYRLVLDGDEAELEAMFVDPPFIGKGVGKRLWRDMLAIAQQAGARRLVCQADPNAEAFYLAMGMRRFGEKPSESIPGRSLPMLELALPASG